MAASSAARVAPGLADVSETMLWALHNRATEASRRDGILSDPDCVRIHRFIDYKFDRQFGVPAGSLAARAAAIDQVLRHWIARHPDGIVVSLGEGLETQARRVDNGRIRWLSVDLPDAIRLREQFLKPTERFRHIAVSVLDPAWMEAVEPDADVFIVAQGLLMYLQPNLLAGLFGSIARRFPGAEMIFDVVPRWYSRLTLRGLNATPHYRLPAMPWGINSYEIAPTLHQWLPGRFTVTLLPYGMPRGLPHLAGRIVHHLPFVRHELPVLVHLTLAAKATTSNIILIRNQSMSTLNGVLEAATRNADTSNDLAIAAGQVVAKRVALGMAAAINPLQADRAEFGRILPEKVEAFSAAGMIMLERSNEVGWELTRLASDEVMTTARAAMAIAACATPAAMAEAQGKFAVAWFDRAARNFFALGMLAFGTQKAVMAPIQETVAANTARLSC